MNLRKAGIAVAFALFLALAFSAKPAQADEWDQAIKLTFNQPVQVPGKVIPAGTYWFRMEGGHSDPSGVVPDVAMNVYSENRNQIVATFNVVPSQTVKNPKTDQGNGGNDVSGHIVVTLANRAPQPLALMDLSYPGWVEGQDLAVHYPKAELKTLNDFPRITMKVSKNGDVQTDEHTSH